MQALTVVSTIALRVQLTSLGIAFLLSPLANVNGCALTYSE